MHSLGGHGPGQEGSLPLLFYLQKGITYRCNNLMTTIFSQLIFITFFTLADTQHSPLNQ